MPFSSGPDAGGGGGWRATPKLIWALMALAALVTLGIALQAMCR